MIGYIHTRVNESPSNAQRSILLRFGPLYSTLINNEHRALEDRCTTPTGAKSEISTSMDVANGPNYFNLQLLEYGSPNRTRMDLQELLEFGYDYYTTVL